MRGAWDKLYGEVRTQFGDADFGYVRQLEATENRLMKAFDEVVDDDDVPASIKKMVSNYLPTIRSHHDMMRDRKWSMRHPPSSIDPCERSMSSMRVITHGPRCGPFVFSSGALRTGWVSSRRQALSPVLPAPH